MSKSDDDIQSILEKTFNLTSFRPLQKDIITDIINGRDLLVLMPTGAGKSLCYQLPGVYQNGVSVIISPLLSLIYDQVQGLNNLKISVAFWNSQTSVVEKNNFTNLLRKGECKFLYTTPEAIVGNMSLNNLLKELYNTKLLQRFVIDEAHCVSNWGHDFRQDYLELTCLKQQYQNVQIVAFTATATPKVQMDIIKQLSLVKPKIYRQSFIRDNLTYDVRVRNNNFDTTIREIASIIKKKYTAGSGIIYCLSRNKCEEVALELVGLGISADYYHAQIHPKKKETVQNKWISGEIQVIVATIAFALGINKRDVRFVIHLTMPKSIEGYYQETGRAGRDGLKSDCLLYYSIQDKVILESMARKTQEDNGKSSKIISPVSSVSRVQDMYDFATNIFECRKEQLSQYLGEHIDYTCETGCDNCLICGGATYKYKSMREVTRIILDYLLNMSAQANSESTGLDFTEFQKYLAREVHEFNKSELKRIFSKLLKYKILETKAYLSKGKKNICEIIKIGEYTTVLIEEMKKEGKKVTAYEIIKRIDAEIFELAIKKIGGGGGSGEDYVEIYLQPKVDTTIIELKKQFKL